MVKIKVCGLTNSRDLRLAQELGADYVGFIFHPHSPRFITPDQVRRICLEAGHRSLRVGVFVNASASIIRRVFSECCLDVIQLHGDETPEFCSRLNLPCWKAVRVRDESTLLQLPRFSCEAILIDAHSPTVYGGSGRQIEPRLIAAAIASQAKIVVAGGITANHLKKIISLRPFAVDICSSLEKFPGQKDEKKIKEFFDEANMLRGSA